MTVELKTVDIRPLRHTFGTVAEQIGGDKAASRYQEAMLGAQSKDNFHYRSTWDSEYEIYDSRRTAIKMRNWYDLKDPRQFYYASWTMARAKQQDAMESNFQFVESRGLLDAIPENVRQLALDVLVPLRHVAWGANMNNCTICDLGYGTAFSASSMFYALDSLGVAQYLTRIGWSIADPGALDIAKHSWLTASVWQDLRRYVEDTLVVQDPFELFIAQNLVLDGLLYPLIYDEFVDGKIALQQGGPIAMLTSFMVDISAETSRWIDATVKVAVAESADNKKQIQEWTDQWSARAIEALTPIASLAFGDQSVLALEEVQESWVARCSKLGLFQ
ncbi:phenol hydroxylase [Ampullimonas aquatilis]|uniref:phenol hydroxylase n=1 Tax=Ampullimonas aquatilis TaxID=1341549 RepID=UPI003C77E9A4